MKVSLNWLKEYVDINIPLKDFLDKMVMLGLEVEDYTDLSQSMQNVVVGRIESLTKHPDADKLQICMIDIGESKVQIVTGASNVFEGAVVPAALNNSVLPNGVRIKKGKLRGVESNGMLCSGGELVIDNSVYPGAEVDGILILKDDLKPGTDMRQVLGMDDVIIDFKATANRPDWLCVNGLAREAAVALGEKVKYPAAGNKKRSGKINDYIKVDVKAPDLCRRYMAGAVRNVKIKESPEWLKRHLRAAGIRSINNIVDITNLVMLEYGQPMHAFDWRDIKGSQICVRRAGDGEKLLTLDGKERILSVDMLVIASEDSAIGLAGIMGGENSEIKDDTTTVIFESANFRRDNIRHTARALGLRTESSARFERGIDLMTPQKALERTMALVDLLDCGEVVDGIIDICSCDTMSRKITVNADKVNALLGINIPVDTMVGILNSLEITTYADGSILNCTIPYYRDDIEGTADIAEEVLRVYGYDKIIHTDMSGLFTRGKMVESMAEKEKAVKSLTALGLNEILTYSFVSMRAYDMLGLPENDELRNSIQILNPLGEDYSIMRTTLAHNMMNVFAVNISRKNKKGRFFEVGNVYIPKALPLTELPDERTHICIGIYGEGEDFYSIKGVVDTFLSSMGVRGEEYNVGGKEFLHPGRKALISKRNVELGYIGEVHPDTLKNYQITSRVYIAELDIKNIVNAALNEFDVKPLPKYPRVERDLAVIVDKDITIGQLSDKIKQSGKGLLESFELFDIYEGIQVGPDKKSVAFSLNFQASDRTLTDEEIINSFNRIVKALEKEYSAKLR